MIWSSDIVPWLTWVFPAIGALLALVLAKAGKIRDVTVVVFSFLGWLMAVFMMPDLFSPPSAGYLDTQLGWLGLTKGMIVNVGMLVDPLSIILSNVVALLGLLILIYSLKYVEHDPNATRYWFLMALFMSGMQLLVMADNLIAFFVGWKIVGLCSFGLIGYYYSDEKEHWIGGPAPFSFWKPSRCGLKALLVTTLGDILLLGGILLLFSYAHTFNFVDLFNTASTWLTLMAKNPGAIALLGILMLGGPLAKSAQFPFQEWLPEAMAGPTPVSALIHAATMVKAGVYLVARILPIFFIGYWMLGFPEASVFFVLVAAVGGFTLFLGASQALVGRELKKALAYSTMSAIGYMMLALGISGLSSGALVEGVASGIFFLINHGIFKAALFLCAGVIIHVSGSIYMPDMKLSRQKMRLTWIFMWVAALSLIGFPPFSGFWSKDDVLLSCLNAGQYALFAVALITVILTALYVVRFMGIIFHNESAEVSKERSEKEAGVLMLAPIGALAALTIAIGAIGPWVSSFLSDVFNRYYTQTLALQITSSSTAASTGSNVLFMAVVVAIASTSMALIGMAVSYRFFISHRMNPENLISEHTMLSKIHRFVWNRWYIEAFYNKVFVGGGLALKDFSVCFIETPLDRALNLGVPTVFTGIYMRFKKIQTGMLSVNMLYFLLLLVAALLVLFGLGVL
jgi:NADH-quinone oxidoreductase subunit L